MPDGQVLEFAGVTKQFGTVTAVSDFSARIEPGLVTGFLGPNGAGKTTTLRVLLGLVRATSGTATIGGVPYAKLPRPLQTVGAVLEASSFHPGRTAANHLTIYAQAAGLPVGRVDEVLGMVGLAGVGGSKVGGFSLGMKQRLSLAYALLGDPGVLILDEPSNGLDPEGIIWMRSLLRELARQGRTVLVSSHLLAEVQQTVDALLIITQGRLVFAGGLGELTDPAEFVTVVDSPDRPGLAAALKDADAQFELLRSGFTVRGSSPADVGTIAAGAGVGLSLLQRRGPGLEEIFLDLVNGTRLHPSAAGTDAGTLAADDGGLDAPPAPEPVEPGGRVAAEGGASRPGESSDAGGRDTAPVPDPVEGPPTRPAEPAEAAEAADATPDGADPDDADAPPGALPRPAFAVASTGVIDIISADAAASDPSPGPAASGPPPADAAPDYTAADAARDTDSADGSDGPDFFEPTDSVTDPAPGAAADDADPSTGDVIIAASEASDDADDTAETDMETENRPATQRWEAQFDPVVEPDADDELSDSDREADEFFADGAESDADEQRDDEEGRR